MIRIRSNVFETNSSAEHTVCLNPFWRQTENAMYKDLMARIKWTAADIKKHINKKTGVYEIPRNLEFEYGKYEDFTEKLNYIIFLCVMRHRDMLVMRKNDGWGDEEGFTSTSANKVLKNEYSDFIQKLVKHINDVYGLYCTDIQFKAAEKGEGRYCTGELNHQITFYTDERFFGLDFDPYDIITTDGLEIDYQFC